MARAYYTLEVMFVQCRVIEMKEEVEDLAYEDATSQNLDFREKVKLEWMKLLDEIV